MYTAEQYARAKALLNDPASEAKYGPEGMGKLHQKLTEYESVNAKQLTASILVVEARMATVLTDFGGPVSNLDDVFEPDAAALDITAGAES